VCSSLALAALAGCGSAPDGSSGGTPDGAAAATAAPTDAPVPSTASTEDVAADASATIPPGHYVRIVDDATLASLETAGLDEDFLRFLADDGPSSFDYEFSTDGQWTQGADVCRCGVSKREDFGTYSYDDRNRLVTTSESPGCNRCSTVLDWTIDGDVLTFTGITFPDGTHADTRDPLPNPLPDGFDPFGYLISTGSWQMEQVGAETMVLDVGMTPGWDSIVDPILAALDDASSGTVQGRFDLAWMDAHFGPDIEPQLIDAVASGDLDMAYVATRAFADPGITDFDALSAPFLVHDYAVQQAILDSDLPERMLAGVELAGVTALALAAGPFRYLQGVDRTYTAPSDFAGATFHTFPSPIYAATADALGATHTDAFGPARDQGLDDGTIDLTENTLGWMNSNGRTDDVTIGAALWPATGVLIINTDVLDGMTADQRTVLRQVVDSGLPTTAAYAATDAGDLARLCTTGKGVHVATRAELDDLRAAVQPVYDQLDEDETTAAYIDEIRQLAAASAPEEGPRPDDSCAE